MYILAVFEELVNSYPQHQIRWKLRAADYEIDPVARLQVSRGGNKNKKIKTKMYLGKDRKLNRWTGYDYSTPGWYFITICTKNKVVQFGKVKNGKMVLNVYGQIALKYFKQISDIYRGVELDEFQIMPNHIHGIIFIKEKPVGVENDEKLMTVGTDTVGAGKNGKFLPVGTEHCSVPTLHAPTDPSHYGLISKIIKSFKELVTKEIRHEFDDYNFVWQRSFHDHVIRGEEDYNAIKYYIQQNPAKWDEDGNNPINIK